jgi:capsular exopolysaccharide synthesis family protein
VAADQFTEPDLSPASDAPAPAINPLHVALRRWPLLAVGLGIGAVLGVLFYTLATPMYQSSAQVLVLKKRADMVPNGDVRAGVMEDYVATQIPVIKSESIRRAAARRLRNEPLTHPLPDDELAAAGVIAGGLVVMRDKDAATASSAGNSVLSLSFRGRSPDDTRRILTAVIEAYKGDLYGTLDQATKNRIASLHNTIEVRTNQRKLADQQRLKRQDELREITTESLPSIRARVTLQKDKLYALELDLVQLTNELELIARAGNNRRDRRVVYAQLTAQVRPDTLSSTETSAPELAIRRLEADIASRSRELGKDHPTMLALVDQLNFYKKEYRRQNPDDPTGQFDELTALSKRLQQRKQTLELQSKKLQARLLEDEAHLKEAGRVQDYIDAAASQIQQADQEITKLTGELAVLQAAHAQSQDGGYTAREITPPNNGAKVTPVLYQSLLMGLVLGLMLGGGAVVLAELTDKSFRSPAEIRRRLGLPIVGHVPQIRVDEPGNGSDLDPVLVAALRPKSSEAEAYRGVRTQLFFSTQGRGHQVIQVTSPSPGDGKSTLAANLAISLAQSGKRTVLIDCDFRKPRVHKLFDLPPSEFGLAGVVAGEASIGTAVHSTAIPHLDVLPCGPRPANPAELLTSPQFQAVLGELKASYDFVVVDTPPMLAVSDPAAVAPRVDGVLMVFRMTKQVRPAAERAREQLAALGANVLGVVVNGWSGSGRGYEYGYNYGYTYADYEYADEYADAPSQRDGELPALK